MVNLESVMSLNVTLHQRCQHLQLRQPASARPRLQQREYAPALHRAPIERNESVFVFERNLLRTVFLCG
jgi:hypothetical protein